MNFYGLIVLFPEDILKLMSVLIWLKRRKRKYVCY